MSNLFQRMNYSEKRSIAKANKNNWLIQVGEKYIYQANIWGGDFNVYKAIPDIHDICVKYSLFEEE